MIELTDLIKILLIIPIGVILSRFNVLISSNSPLKSRYSYKDFRREFSVCNSICLMLFFIISIYLALFIVCFTDFNEIVTQDSDSSLSEIDEFFINIQKINNSPIFLFLIYLAGLFLLSILIYIFFQNRNKTSAFKYLEINAEDNGFIHPIFEAAKHNKGLIIETVDNTIYKGMCLYLTLDRDSTSTEKYICFLVFEKLFYDQNKNEIISIYKNYELFEDIKNTKEGNKIIHNIKIPPRAYCKEVEFSKYFEIYKNHSVIFKLSDIKTIRYF